jgi:membrane-anchored protein YejM (alkaline phosphatase superfamily)
VSLVPFQGLVLSAVHVHTVSVGQKTSGYVAGSLDFTPDLLRALDFVDSSLGQVVAKLVKKGLYNDTLIIVASKHGQTPIDPKKFVKVDPAAVTNATKVDVLFQTVGSSGWIIYWC